MLALITAFKKTVSPYTAPLYAMLAKLGSGWDIYRLSY